MISSATQAQSPGKSLPIALPEQVNNEVAVAVDSLEWLAVAYFICQEHQRRTPWAENKQIIGYSSD